MTCPASPMTRPQRDERLPWSPQHKSARPEALVKSSKARRHPCASARGAALSPGSARTALAMHAGGLCGCLRQRTAPAPATRPSACPRVLPSKKTSNGRFATSGFGVKAVATVNSAPAGRPRRVVSLAHQCPQVGHLPWSHWHDAAASVTARGGGHQCRPTSSHIAGGRSVRRVATACPARRSTAATGTRVGLGVAPLAGLPCRKRQSPPAVTCRPSWQPRHAVASHVQ